MSTRMHQAMAGTLLVLGALQLAGCEPDPAVPIVLSCDLEYTGRELDGVWTLSAHGTRKACGQRRLEGKLEISTTMPIQIDAKAQPTMGAATGPEVSAEEDAFVDRI